MDKQTKEPCCNAKIREEMRVADEAITAVYFDLSNIQRFDGTGPVKTGQHIKVYYNKTMKSGEVRNQKRKSFLTHNYCPFCGKEYK